MEAPSRYEFFAEFERMKNADMTSYFVRHRTLPKRMKHVAGQCLPQLSASISLLQASSSSPTINDITVAKLLGFTKEVAQG